MSEMIERVADAIVKTWNPPLIEQGDKVTAEKARLCDLPARGQELAKTVARAAIAAMREPTEEMAQAGWKGSSVPQIWQRMIDEALGVPLVDRIAARKA